MVVDDHVAGFICGPGAPVVDAPVKENSRANAGANAGIKNVSVAAAGSPQRFCKPGGLGVILEFHGAAVASRDFSSERIVPPASHVRWIQHDAGVRIERPGCANSNGSRRVACPRRKLQEFIDCARHRR